MNARPFEKTLKTMAAVSCLAMCFSIGPAGTAIAATYYVATNGNDGNSGSQARPWRTIRHAAETVAAGDTVIVREGKYDEDVLLAHDRGGVEETQPVFLRVLREGPGRILSILDIQDLNLLQVGRV